MEQEHWEIGMEAGSLVEMAKKRVVSNRDLDQGATRFRMLLGYTAAGSCGGGHRATSLQRGPS